LSGPPQPLLPLQNDMLRGVAYMLGAAALFSVMNALVKLLSADFSTAQIVWARNIGHLAFIAILFTPRLGLRLYVSGQPRIQIARSLLQLCSTVCYFTAIAYIPLTEAASISFTAPLLVTALSVPLLGEAVGWRRWAAVAVGFVGALIVIRPGAGLIHWAAILCLVSALCYALYQILTRRAASFDRPETTVLYSAVVGSIVMSAAAPFDWSWPADWTSGALLASLGVFGGLGHYYVAKAFRFGSAAVISPFNYAQLLGAAGFGYLFFDHLPDGWTWLGAAVIVASGVYIAWREAVRGRQSR
jgi:drug/metabolite transporter (DMT)-like permease